MSLEERVSRLERQNRRLKQGLAVVVLVVAGAVIMGATRQVPGVGETVTAQRFVVKDKSGRERAILSMTKDGEPSLHLYDKDGKTRVALGMFKGSLPALGLYDKSGKVRAGLNVGKGGSPIIQLNDLNGRGRIVLAILKENTAGIILRDAFGKAKWAKTAK